MNSLFPSWKIATAYLSLTLFGCIAVSNFSLTKGVGVFLEKVSMFPCTRDDPWQKPPLQMIFPIQLVSFRDLKCLWSMVLQRPCFLFRNFKEKWKKSNHQRLTRLILHVIACSFFSVDMAYRLKLFQAKPSRLLKKWSWNYTANNSLPILASKYF